VPLRIRRLRTSQLLQTVIKCRLDGTYPGMRRSSGMRSALESVSWRRDPHDPGLAGLKNAGEFALTCLYAPEGNCAAR
jgi:hypothetical protein